jgi:hypothetical protein
VLRLQDYDKTTLKGPMNILKTVFVILGLFVTAYSLTVDFAPIQVGNVWVYEESFRNEVWYTSPEYKITKTIQITKTESRNDTTYFTAFIRDSGIVLPYYNDSNRIDVHYAIQGFKTKDTVKTSKANDSIVVSEKGIENFNIGEFFPLPVRDTASPLPYESFYVWENLIIDRYDASRASPSFSNIDHFIILQNVGLLERSHDVTFNFSEPIGGTTTISLISFNGKPAPNINLTSVNHFPQNKRMNSNQTAFRQFLCINQGNHIGPNNVRAVFDVRGRAVSPSGLTNRHLNNGIYLSY